MTKRLKDELKTLSEWRTVIQNLPNAAAPTPAALGDVVVTTDETGRAVAVTRQDEEGRILSVIWEAPTPPAQEDKPVGYITPVYILDKQDHAQISRNREYEWQVPLFSHPTNDKLRKAAEEVILWLDGDYMLSASHVLAKNLRAALEGK